MAQPWIGSGAIVFKSSRSTVPCTRSVGLLMLPSFNDMSVALCSNVRQVQETVFEVGAAHEVCAAGATGVYLPSRRVPLQVADSLTVEMWCSCCKARTNLWGVDTWLGIGSETA